MDDTKVFKNYLQRQYRYLTNTDLRLKTRMECLKKKIACLQKELTDLENQSKDISDNVSLTIDFHVKLLVEENPLVYVSCVRWIQPGVTGKLAIRRTDNEAIQTMEKLCEGHMGSDSLRDYEKTKSSMIKLNDIESDRWTDSSELIRDLAIYEFTEENMIRSESPSEDQSLADSQ